MNDKNTKKLIIYFRRKRKNRTVPEQHVKILNET